MYQGLKTDQLSTILIYFSQCVNSYFIEYYVLAHKRSKVDLDSIADDLAAATEALLSNDTTDAYTTVNSIDHKLFDTANDQGEQNILPLMQIFKPLQDNIDSTRDALRNNDTANALQLLNSTDAELLKITPQPPVEESQEEEEAATEGNSTE